MRHANASLLDLLLELQTLDRVPRSGYFLRGISDCESVSEHTFHLALLVWFLAGDEPAVDRAHAVELALMHDLAELRIGDLPRTATTYLPADVKHAAERRAAADILAPADPKATALYEEYEDGATAEARFVRACDKLQLMIKVTVYESWGHRGLAEFWGNPANFPQSDFNSIQKLFRSLQERATASTAPPASPAPPSPFTA
ncbi:MAG: HD domain-containing protein [Thermoanaerobaculia bacterium]|nr:HD domain-containing protein [Thermoanaerobaculia bacterium]MBP9824894.1 HD domain-containing protein [Thermoanaerobaculia bacterium]